MTGSDQYGRLECINNGADIDEEERLAPSILTRSIAVDYAPEIRSVAICPGGVDTPLNRDAFRQSSDPERARQETIDLHLTGRMAQPGDIAELVVFVASEKGSFINGQPIRIDGGMGIKISGSKKD